MPKPNVLFIFTDQHALQAMGCYRDTPCQTPNLDALAARGARFENAYTACPLCLPTRASIMTGHYPHRHGLTCNSDNTGNVAASLHELSDRPALLSRRLGEAGSRCGYSGKWHIGTDGGKLYDQTTEAALPKHFGFEGQNFAGHGSGGWHYPEYREYLAKHGLELELDRNPNGTRACAVTKGPEEVHVSHYITDHTLALIDQYAAGAEPFFIWHNFWGPHVPCFAPQRFVDMYRNLKVPPPPNHADPHCEERIAWQVRRHAEELNWDPWEVMTRYYYAFTTFIDYQIGRMLQHLETRGVADNTIVIFSADHGDYMGCHGGLEDKGWGHYEEIQRVPMIVHVPPALRGSIGVADGTVFGEFAGLTDIYPTILDAAGVEQEPGFAHGDSLLKLVRGGPVEWRDDIHVESYGTGHLPATMFTGRCGDIKYGFNFGGTDELYDLSADPYELDNRIDDPSYADTVLEMRQRMKAWMERTHYHPHGVREFTRCRRLGPART